MHYDCMVCYWLICSTFERVLLLADEIFSERKNLEGGGLPQAYPCISMVDTREYSYTSEAATGGQSVSIDLVFEECMMSIIQALFVMKCVLIYVHEKEAYIRRDSHVVYCEFWHETKG